MRHFVILLAIITIHVANGQNIDRNKNYIISHYPHPAPHGIIREGFDLTFYADRKPNPHGGLLHSWGPLAYGSNNPCVDMIMVQIHWNLTHVGPNQADFSFIDNQIDDIIAAGKKVYLYPHIAWPPRWTNIKVVDSFYGWIDYFDPKTHEMQLQWTELIAKKYGKDPRISAIRMSLFDHGESWVHAPRDKDLIKMAKKKGVSIIEISEPYILDIYKTYLKHSTPNKLIAHGGGLQGTTVEWAIRQGTGHATGTHQLDFAGRNHFGRPQSATLVNGHLKINTMAEDGLDALYIAESQALNSITPDLDLDSIRNAVLTLFSSHVIHGTNYLLTDETLFNQQNYKRITPKAPVSPDWSGRLIRRMDGSAKAWQNDTTVYQIGRWVRTLLGTTDETTPEAFVQLSQHYSAGHGQWVKALEHGMIMDFKKSNAKPVIANQMLAGDVWKEEIFDNKEHYFAKSSSHFYFNLNIGYQKSLINRIGDLLEIRVTYMDEGNGSFEVLYPQQNAGIVSAGAIRKENTGKWRTGCFLIVDPEVVENINYEIQVISKDDAPLTVCLIRVMKQYD